MKAKNTSPSPTPLPPGYSTLHHPQPFSPTTTTTTDGASVELPGRRRGRPPGSKNKPKPLALITTAAEAALSPATSSVPSMQTLLVQIQSDHDVVESIFLFCRRKSLSLSLISASGSLSHFTLRQPTSPPSTITFCEKFDILSLAATLVSEKTINSTPFYVPGGFSVTVAGPQGQVVGGAVGGPLVASGPVLVVAASFESPLYHRLPEDEERSEEKGGTAVVVAGCGDGGFSCHLGASGVWSPVAGRPPY